MRGNMTPPTLPGYTGLRALGEGSTSIVYLYRQHTPKRDVAVKIGASPLDGHARARFRTEADRMAGLSSHPHILSVHGTGVTPDGLDYIVSEYAPGGTYRPLMLARRLNVAQTLDLGVKLAGALHTAHRAGIVHRDVKPGNVLITASGQPALADFGVSATIYQSAVPTGHSPAWAAPEVLDGTSGGGVAADVYSLGATLFAMLTGCAPSACGYPMTPHRQMARTVVGAPSMPPDAEIPSQVGRVLRKALSENPDSRHHTALDFARALQDAQMALYGRATPVVVPDAPAYPKGLRRGVRRMTAKRNGGGDARVRFTAIIIVTVMVAAAIAAFVVAVVSRSDSATLGRRTVVEDFSTAGTDDDAGAVIGIRAVPSPERLRGVFEGNAVTFIWDNPDPRDGDFYAWTVVDGNDADREIRAAATDDTTVTLHDVVGPRLCLSVSIVRADRVMSQRPSIACAAR